MIIFSWPRPVPFEVSQHTIRPISMHTPTPQWGHKAMYTWKTYLTRLLCLSTVFSWQHSPCKIHPIKSLYTREQMRPYSSTGGEKNSHFNRKSLGRKTQTDTTRTHPNTHKRVRSRCRHQNTHSYSGAVTTSRGQQTASSKQSAAVKGVETSEISTLQGAPVKQQVHNHRVYIQDSMPLSTDCQIPHKYKRTFLIMST